MAISNLERYKKDLKSLIRKGELLHIAMESECFPSEFYAHIKEAANAESILKNLPHFNDAYQSWYSEAKALIKQLLPDRLDDFVAHYEKPKNRKEITYENYRLLDYLQGLTVSKTTYQKEKVVGPEAALPQFHQQLAIV